MTDRPLDVVVYGATGFTGSQAAAWLAKHGGPALRFGIAGRSEEKLRAVREKLGRDVPIVVADAGDREAVGRMAAGARVVLSTAGPYARYGDAVVDACVAHHTDYVDITGETAWVRRVIDRHHARAAAEGTRIVPMCGFDSVPSDLGAWLVVRALQAKGAVPADVRGRFTIRGGVNGGSLASALHMYEDPDGLAALGDPVVLNPEASRTDTLRAANPDLDRAVWDDELGVWVAPFVMGPINTRVVRRTAALLEAAGEGYGPAFRYSEGQRASSRVQAGAMSGGLRFVAWALGSSAVRRVVAKVVPAPGQGPNEAALDGGFFRLSLVGTATDGTTKVLGTFSSQGDPGNRVTVAFLCSSALCLVQDRERLPARAGVLTPVTAFGEVLAERVRGLGMVLAVG